MQVNTKPLYALAYLLAGLLALVIVVGLARQVLDTTAVALMLGPALTGLVTGIVLRERDRNKDKGSGP